jgi:hypothetical protein
VVNRCLPLLTCLALAHGANEITNIFPNQLAISPDFGVQLSVWLEVAGSQLAATR